MANDPKLGHNVEVYLKEFGLSTANRASEVLQTQGTRITVENHVHGIMDALGLDLNDESLKDTPGRVSKMFCTEIFEGLNPENFPACSTFKSTTDELVLIKGIEVKSMCEHHLLPFVGTAFIGYIPSGKVMGLSKFGRVVDYFARRPQMQERLTEQIARTMNYVLNTQDVAVIVSCRHMCMELRGVKAKDSTTVTSVNLGRFRSEPNLRNEFLQLVGEV